ncbi:hypothetical protein J6590_080074 [Homalodisca vitripennis]|nr:hypothetical protein J6590_096882 [Homalodisca vitripennis]KAG8319964.1 hypothetical protein J6590_080074 [Homalodisca vitripennis]
MDHGDMTRSGTTTYGARYSGRVCLQQWNYTPKGCSPDHGDMTRSGTTTYEGALFRPCMFTAVELYPQGM